MKSVQNGMLLFTALVMMATMSSTALAEESGAMPGGPMQSLFSANHFGKDWGIMVGAKVWFNQWDLPLEYPVYDGKTQIFEFESDTEMTFIPAFLVRYRNFFMGGSYLPETEYDFESQRNMPWGLSGEEIQRYLYDFKLSGSRKEWDLNLGYFLTPNLAICLGYKAMERDLDMVLDDYERDSYVKHIFPLSAHAPIIGVSAAAPVANHVNLYGNLAYGWISGDASYKYLNDEGKVDAIKFDLDGSYTFAELGLNYIFSLQRNFVSAIVINGGYRFQRLDMKFEGNIWGNSGDQHDATAGFVFGVSGLL